MKNMGHLKKFPPDIKETQFRFKQCFCLTRLRAIATGEAGRRRKGEARGASCSPGKTVASRRFLNFRSGLLFSLNSSPSRRCSVSSAVSKRTAPCSVTSQKRNPAFGCLPKYNSRPAPQYTDALFQVDPWIRILFRRPSDGSEHRGSLEAWFVQVNYADKRVPNL